MTASAQQAPSVSTPDSRSRPRAGVWLRLVSAARLIVGSLLCLTPLTAIVALGWMQRVMRREAAIALLLGNG